MAEASDSIIRKKIVCPEHMCRIFSDLKIIERTAPGGDLEIEVIEVKAKKEPRLDRRGRLLVANEMSLIRNRSFVPEDPRHKVAKAHRHITDTGEPGASGKYDPKTITQGGTRYLLLPNANSTCELCEHGDMIHPDNRFEDSTYRPRLV